jgi:hypothetical protein
LHDFSTKLLHDLSSLAGRSATRRRSHPERLAAASPAVHHPNKNATLQQRYGNYQPAFACAVHHNPGKAAPWAFTDYDTLARMRE